MTRAEYAGPAPTAAQWDLWTTSVRIVVTDPSVLARSTCLLRRWLAAVEVVASRFRPDSEVCRIARSGATTHSISPLLRDLVTTAIAAATISQGRVDPTVGTVVSRLDTPNRRRGNRAATSIRTERITTWHDIDLQEGVLGMPPRTLLDFGAIGKAFAADRAAESISRAVGCGVLVSLGGDLRAAGPPPDHGWTVLVQDQPGEPASLVDLGDATAIATSSTLHRRLGYKREHHIVDPLTQRPIDPSWNTVSVAADTCVTANTWSTAALVCGAGAPTMLTATGLPARLVGTDGNLIRLGGWPT